MELPSGGTSMAHSPRPSGMLPTTFIYSTWNYRLVSRLYAKALFPVRRQNHFDP
jgi:hypothetical protein